MLWLEYRRTNRSRSRRSRGSTRKPASAGRRSRWPSIIESDGWKSVTRAWSSPPPRRIGPKRSPRADTRSSASSRSRRSGSTSISRVARSGLKEPRPIRWTKMPGGWRSRNARNHPAVRASPGNGGRGGSAPRRCPTDRSSRAAWDSLVGEFPDFDDYSKAVSCAVNEEYARMTTALSDGDEVAFLPPVSAEASRSQAPATRSAMSPEPCSTS